MLVEDIYVERWVRKYRSYKKRDNEIVMLEEQINVENNHTYYQNKSVAGVAVVTQLYMLPTYLSTCACVIL